MIGSRPGYRCRIRADYARLADDGHPRSLFVGERGLVLAIDNWLEELLSPEQHAGTVAQIVEASASQVDPAIAAAERLKQEASAGIRRIVDAVAAGHLESSEVAERLRTLHEQVAAADTVLARRGDVRPLSSEEVATVLAELGTMVELLTTATRQERAAFYQALRLRASYDPQERAVDLSMALSAGGGASERVGGGT